MKKIRVNFNEIVINNIRVPNKIFQLTAGRIICLPFLSADIVFLIECRVTGKDESN
jgi:hypothetical protein